METISGLRALIMTTMFIIDFNFRSRENTTETTTMTATTAMVMTIAPSISSLIDNGLKKSFVYYVP